MTTPLIRHLGVGVLLLCLTTAAAAQTSAQGPYHPDGVNVRRWAQGEITYLNSETRAVTGGESWQLTVAADGSRTIDATNHLLGPDFRHTVHLRVGPDFQPRELFTEYWLNGVFRNATFFAVRGLVLDITSRFADTTTHDIVKMPQRFSFIPHPLASDVWHGWYYDKDKGGKQPITVYDVDPTAKQPYQVGKIDQQTIAFIGEEQVTVPAGTFLCDHFRINDIVDYYVTGPDAIFVKFVWAPAKAEYVLTSLRQGNGP